MLNFLRKHWKGLLISSLAIGTAIFCIYFPPMMLGFMIGSIASTNAFAVLGAGALPGAAATVAMVASATVASLSALVIGVGSLMTKLCKRCCCPTTKNEDEPKTPDLESSHNKMNDQLGVSDRQAATAESTTLVNHYGSPIEPKLVTKDQKVEQQEEEEGFAMNVA